MVDFDRQNGQKTEAELNKRFGENKVKFIYGDVTDYNLMKNVFQGIKDVYGSIDIFCNNAGVQSSGMRWPKKILFYFSQNLWDRTVNII